MARGLLISLKLTAGAGITMVLALALSFSPPRVPGALSRTLSKRLLNAASGIGGFGGQSSGERRWSRVTSSHVYQRRASQSPSSDLSVVSVGDLATVDYSLRTNEGAPFESLFDQGRVRLLVGGGGFAPFVHKAVLGMESGEEKTVNIPPLEAFGEYDPDMTGRLEIEAAPTGLKVGMRLQLWNGLKATVTEVTDKDFKLDWNPVGAGTSLVMDMKVLDVVDATHADSMLRKATFAGGCFWGLELAFQRTDGVVNTQVGYAQGFVDDPSYSQVCSGKTGHTEAVQVLYDPSETSYEILLRVFFQRHDPLQANGQGNDQGPQYRAGVYYHDEEQREVAEAMFAKEQEKRGPRKIVTELEPVTSFFCAEEEHQQFLQKGGQDARKTATEAIRCYG